MRRRILSLVLAISLVLGLCFAASSVSAEGTEAKYPYFVNQISGTPKMFYDALHHMLEKGTFLGGNGYVDMTEFGITQQQIKDHLDRKIDLLSDYAIGRDAFYLDYPSVFYVDFSNITLRITKEEKGYYHLYMGAGRYPTYYTEGFNNIGEVEAAISEYNSALEAAVAEVRSAGDEHAMIVKAHDIITHGTSYRLEDKCASGNVGFIRTAYGSLVKHEGVCEAYSRAFKAIMDEVGIPCVLTSGFFRHEDEKTGADILEEHMWACVELDGGWYAVDATMDDPANYHSNNSGEDGYETGEYCVVGQDIMSLQHMEDGTLSGGHSFVFTYPELELKSYGMQTAYSNAGLLVNFSPFGESVGDASGVFYVSYNGMNLTKMKENGKYLLVKFYYEDKDTGKWEYSPWSYVLTDIYNIEEEEDRIIFGVPHIQYMEFAVTDISPGDYSQYLHVDNPEDLEEYVECITYDSGDEKLLADSGMLHNPNGTYVKPPYIKTVDPPVNVSMKIGTQYHVVATYDEELKLLDEGKPSGIVFGCESVRNRTGTTGEKYAKVENFTWDGHSTVSFDFTPSEMWLDDSIFYEFTPTNLVGVDSGKVPNTISYLTSFPCRACAYKSEGFDFNVFGKPTLLDSSGFSTEGWETSDGESVSDKLTHRMMLVASDATSEEQAEMDGLLQGEGVLDAEYFNIYLTLCKEMVVKTGDGVRVCLGFPEGYGPDDAGVTFKAYHFYEENGETKVEEIPCVITPYGLVITCKSFSPFTIAAVEGVTETSEKTLLVMNPEVGGKIEADTKPDGVGNITIGSGEEITFTVTADEGYVIDTLNVGSKSIQVSENESQKTVTVKAEDISGSSAFVSAEFVYESATDGEAGTPVNPAGSEEEPQVMTPSPSARPTQSPAAAAPQNPKPTDSPTPGGEPTAQSAETTPVPTDSTTAPTETTPAPTKEATPIPTETTPAPTPNVTAAPQEESPSLQHEPLPQSDSPSGSPSTDTPPVPQINIGESAEVENSETPPPAPTQTPEVTPPPIPSPTSEPAPAPSAGGADAQNAAANAAVSPTPAPDAPQTGESRAFPMWIGLMAVSVLGIGALAYFVLRGKNRQRGRRYMR